LQRRGRDAPTQETGYVATDSNPLWATHKFCGGAEKTHKVVFDKDPTKQDDEALYRKT